MGSLGLIFMRKAEPRGVQSHGAGARQGGWAPAGAASIPHGSSPFPHCSASSATTHRKPGAGARPAAHQAPGPGDERDAGFRGRDLTSSRHSCSSLGWKPKECSVSGSTLAAPPLPEPTAHLWGGFPRLGDTGGKDPCLLLPEKVSHSPELGKGCWVGG